MTAQVIQIRDFLPIHGPPMPTEECAEIIILPMIRTFKPKRQEQNRRLDSGLPSDCEP